MSASCAANLSTGDVLWNPREGTLEIDKLRGVDAVVHLAGAGVGDHLWSARYKETILSSRVEGTSTLAEALSRMSNPPSVLVSASAVGYYGSRGDELLTETSGPGSGFLADVCGRWEAAASAVSEAGIRLVVVRTGVVLSGAGGALKKQLPVFRLGAGARLGRGSQQLSWITRRDVAGAVSHLLRDDDLTGPFNVTAPRPVSNAIFTRALGQCAAPAGRSRRSRNGPPSGGRCGDDLGVPAGIPTGGTGAAPQEWFYIR